MTTSNTRRRPWSTPSSTATTRPACSSARSINCARSSSVLLGPEPPSDPATERLVATAPSQRSTIDIRTIAKGLSNFTGADYGAVVERAREHVFAGDVFQVVPSQQFQRPSTVSPLTLYRVLRALNPSPYMYLLDSGEIQIVGASPEMLMRVHDGLVSYRPIAGTRARGVNETEDLELEHELLHDEKEIAEHVMLVDLGRNDVGRVAKPGTVRVDRLAHIERYSHLMHLVSHVEGRLNEGLDAFDAFDALFPAGTLTGAPKVRAMELIDEFEPVFRGPYGGAVGYFSLSGNADFAITIRTLSLRHGVATVQAGGGVVADSQPEFEFEESINKASAPLLALEIADPSPSLRRRRTAPAWVWPRGPSSFVTRPLARDSVLVGSSRRGSCANSRVDALTALHSAPPPRRHSPRRRCGRSQ